jgi:integrase
LPKQVFVLPADVRLCGAFLGAKTEASVFAPTKETRIVPKLVNSVPKYRRHKQSGQAIVTLSGRDYLLGPHGSKVSRAKYDRLIAEWLDRDRQPIVDAGDGLTVAELASRYWLHATNKHVRGGEPTAEQFKIKTALRQLLRLYEQLAAAEFSPVHLKVVRRNMIDGGWSRGYVNSQAAVLVRMFKWAVADGLIPASVHAALALVGGLRRGESAARETPRVRGVDDATIEATLPCLSPIVRAMIELQLATGCRPGELCIMRPCDIDRSGDVWEYRPTDHKTQHLDHDRVICIGPKGQDVLRPYLLRAADAFCFSPKESAEWHRNTRHESRKTPLSCGNVPGSNRKRRPKRSPRDKFDVASYRRAIHRACDQAFPAPEEIANDPAAVANWQSDRRWSPHQLRHTAATRIRKEFGIEAAKAVLGHSATNVTGIYAEIDHGQAVHVAKMIG